MWIEVLNAATNPRVAAVVRYSDVTVEFVRAFLAGEVAQGFVVLASEVGRLTRGMSDSFLSGSWRVQDREEKST